MRRLVPTLVLFAVNSLAIYSAAGKDFRPPAVPLIASDPYFSVWSMADHLTDDVTRHWTGTPQSLCGLVRIDGKVYRIVGNEPEGLPAMEQRKLQILPTRTVYDFEAGGVGLTLTFMTPALPHDLDVLSRPVTYITWTVQSKDGREHSVSLYFDASGQLAVDSTAQNVVASRFRFGGLTGLRVGSEQQPVLQKAGDYIRIDWGYLYLMAPPGDGVEQVIADWRAARTSFADSGLLPTSDDLETPKPAGDWDGPALVYRFDLGKVGSASISRHLVVAYDESFSMQYLYRWLRPYWRRNGATVADLLEKSLREYESLGARCQQFDQELMTDLRRLGGEDYAVIGALAYRQSLAAQVLTADYDGTPLSFPKENSSCGCVSTVDVIYPASPLLLLFNTTLLKGSMTPVLTYAGTYHWPFKWAPHDLGIYPHANGHDYAPNELNSIEGHMPVEESANMILMADAIAKAEGNADYAARYWPLFKKWAEYLKEKGLDPEKQIVTDDFTGPLAHNANLSVKAISALGAYAQLCEMLGKTDDAASYRALAQRYVKQWTRMATDGDHYRLAFDQPGTWSQKYNLIWDKILGLNLFPPEVTRTEIAFYKKKQNAYGLPLDTRARYTKLDWLFWTATLSGDGADFDALISPAYKFANNTPDRVPLTDWYETDTGKHQAFQARSVVGGVFIKMLADEPTWKKWATRALAPPTR